MKTGRFEHEKNKNNNYKIDCQKDHKIHTERTKYTKTMDRTIEKKLPVRSHRKRKKKEKKSQKTRKRSA